MRHQRMRMIEPEDEVTGISVGKRFLKWWHLPRCIDHLGFRDQSERGTLGYDLEHLKKQMQNNREMKGENMPEKKKRMGERGMCEPRVRQGVIRGWGDPFLWDPDVFVKSNVLCTDNVVIVEGTRVRKNVKCVMFNVYAPQSTEDGFMEFFSKCHYSN
ncbi:hypothetical protein LXL04_024035 [Taraxacum kok-saghyz]